MSTEPSDQVHEGREEITAAIHRADLEYDDAIAALGLVAQQLRTRALVAATAASAGYEVRDARATRDLEVYADLRHGERDVAFLAKGWSDPGFRIGEVLTVEVPGDRADSWLSNLRDFGAGQGVTVTTSDLDGALEVQLECVLFTDGFNARTLAASLVALRQCRRRVEETKQRLLDEFLRGPSASWDGDSSV